METETTPVLHTNIKETCVKNITSSEGIFMKMAIVIVKAIRSVGLHNVFCEADNKFHFNVVQHRRHWYCWTAHILVFLTIRKQ